MPRVLRSFRDGLLVAWLSGFACLTPPGWQVCVGVDAHWAIEPAAPSDAACCEDESGGSEGFSGDDCSGCTDFALSSGAVVRVRPGANALHSHSLFAVPTAFASAVLATPGANICDVSRSPAPFPGTRTTVLRC